MTDKVNGQMHDDEPQVKDAAAGTPAGADGEEQQTDRCAGCTELEQYKSGWQRAQADYRNLLKETEAKRAELVRWSKQVILEEFIPVYDNFKKAFHNATFTDASPEVTNWQKGIEYIMKQFGAILKQHGVEEIKTVGEKFDPERHEALGEEHSDEFAEDIITKEIDAGYKMGDKIIKAAKVIVSKK